MSTKIVDAKKFENILRPIFPKNTEFRFSDKDIEGPYFGIDWKLNTDKTDPNKRSKTIILRIKKGYIYEYNNASDEEKNNIERKLVGYVSKKLKNFDPEHNTPVNDRIPTVEWLISDE